MNTFLPWIIVASKDPKKNSFRGNYSLKYGNRICDCLLKYLGTWWMVLMRYDGWEPDNRSFSFSNKNCWDRPISQTILCTVCNGVKYFLRGTLKYGFCKKSFRKNQTLTCWTLLAAKSVQRVRVSFFRSDFLQNPYFSLSWMIHRAQQLKLK